MEEEVLVRTPLLYMLFPMVAAIAIVISTGAQAARARNRGRRVGVGTFVWAGLFVAILVFLAVWCAIGLVDATERVYVDCCVSIGILGVMVPLRDSLFDKIDALEQRSAPKSALAKVIRIARDVCIIILAAELGHLALETPWNTKEMVNLSAQNILIEYTVIVLAVTVAYFVTQRRPLGPILVLVVCVGVGIAQHFLVRFKEAAILPMDIFAIQTAADVSDQYTYTLLDADLQALSLAFNAIFIACFIGPARRSPKRRLVLDVAWNFALALVFALALDWWFEVPDYREEFGLDIYYWRSNNSYVAQGFIPSFLTAVDDLAIKEPEGYSTERAEQLQAQYAAKTEAMPERKEMRAQSEPQFQELKPSVIIIMNETFTDLSNLDDLHAGYEGPQFFKNLGDTLQRGKIGVSVYGGGTCNSEFEALTGNSLAFVGAGKYPYQMFDFTKADNLARQFYNQGYQTTAIHPMPATNWNRRKVYEEMGFERFLSEDDFPEDVPRFHSGPTDKACYEKILEILNKSDAPQFIHTVTMQNHGGYGQHNIPAERLTDYQPTDVNADIAALNEYLSCIQAADEDLEWFVNELRALNRPVVIAFFGDHHPSISNPYNDAFFNDEDEVTHQERVHETDYLIWANYDVAGNDQVSTVKDLCTANLMSTTLDLIGAPLNDFQKAQIAVHERIPVINAIGYQGTDGTWHEIGTAPYLDTTFHDMNLIDYRRFGEQYA